MIIYLCEMDDNNHLPMYHAGELLFNEDTPDLRAEMQQQAHRLGGQLRIKYLLDNSPGLMALNQPYSAKLHTATFNADAQLPASIASSAWIGTPFAVTRQYSLAPSDEMRNLILKFDKEEGQPAQYLGKINRIGQFRPVSVEIYPSEGRHDSSWLTPHYNSEEFALFWPIALGLSAESILNNFTNNVMIVDMKFLALFQLDHMELLDPDSDYSFEICRDESPSSYEILKISDIDGFCGLAAGMHPAGRYELHTKAFDQIRPLLYQYAEEE